MLDNNNKVNYIEYETPITAKNLNDIQESILKNQEEIKIEYEEIDISKLEILNGSVLEIPTYVDKDNAVVHPSVLYFANGWNGYKYWMAMTPYTDNQYKYENPSIVTSNDGYEWNVPQGLTNPIYPHQATTGGYNADTNLFMSNDEKTMYMIWREKEYIPTAENKVKMLKSVDGINWVDLKTIVHVNGRDNACPIVIKDKNDFVMFTANLLEPCTSLQMYRTNNPEGTWEYIKDIELTLPKGKALWHFEIKKYKNQYLMLATVGVDSDASGNNEFYLYTSNDLDNWKYEKVNFADLYDRKYYKGSFLIKDIENFELDVFYGIYKDSKYQVARGSILFGSGLKNEINSIKKDLQKLKYDEIKYDNFEGATFNENSIWTIEDGGFDISNGKMVSNGSNNIATVNAGTCFGEIEVDFTDLNNSINQWVVFGFQSTSVFYRIGLPSGASGNLVLQRVKSGITELASVKIKDLDLCKVINLRVKLTEEGEIVAYVNNELIINHKEIFNLFGTKVGIQASKSGSVYDNFVFMYNSENLKKINNYYNNVMQVVTGVNKKSVADCFFRSNADNLGNNPQGLTWQNFQGSFKIDNNLACATNAENTCSLLPVTSNNLTVHAEINKNSPGTVAIMIQKDSTNYFRYGQFSTGGDITLEKILGGSRIVILTIEGCKIEDSTLLTVSIESSKFKLYKNGNLIGEIDDDTITNFTKAGIQTSNLGCRFGSFLIEYA